MAVPTYATRIEAVREFVVAMSAGLPHHTHLIEVLNQTADQADAEPYSGDTVDTREVTATNVRAIISQPRSGAEIVQGGEMSTVYSNFKTDTVDGLTHNSWIRDMESGDVFQVVWAQRRRVMGMAWIEGQGRIVEGLR